MLQMKFYDDTFESHDMPLATLQGGRNQLTTSYRSGHLSQPLHSNIIPTYRLTLNLLTVGTQARQAKPANARRNVRASGAGGADKGKMDPIESLLVNNAFIHGASPVSLLDPCIIVYGLISELF